MNDLRKAVLLLEKGDWPAAHEIVQQDEESALACWAHGIDVKAEVAALKKKLSNS